MSTIFPPHVVHAEGCVHCGLRIVPEELVRETVDGRTLDFCCLGCSAAYRIITGVGLSEFYANRDWDEPGVPDGVFEMAFDEKYLERFVTDGGGDGSDKEFSVLVEGVRCASCVWVIEKLLKGNAGVGSARLSYSNHLLRVSFDPEATTPATLLARIAAIGYKPVPYTRAGAELAAQREMKGVLLKFGTAVFLSMQLMAFSLGLYAGLFHGMRQDERLLLQMLAGLVATPVVFFCGSPFLSGAVRSFRNRAPDMDLLVGIGVLSAYFFSVHGLATGGEVYFDSASMIVTFLLAGRLFELLGKRRAAQSISEIMGLAPTSAKRVVNDRVEEVDPGELSKGELVLVSPGERFPADGVVESGVSEVDESAVTGEPFPVAVEAGGEVTSGTLNLLKSLRVRVTGAGSDAFVARIARLVEEAQNRKPPIQLLADRVSAFFVPAVGVVGTLTFFGWLYATGDSTTALMTAVSVLVVACPCALGLATPMAVVVGSGSGASRGILFRGGDVLQAMGRVSTVCFDKTGTLTRGEPAVSVIVPVEGSPGAEDELLRVAATIEASSLHPLGRAIVTEAETRGIDFKPLDDVHAIAGRGVLHDGGEAGEQVAAGSGALFEDIGVDLFETDVSNPSASVIHVARGKKYLGRIELVDDVRGEARETVNRVKRMGCSTLMLTGDTEEAGRRVAVALGIEECFGSMTPEEKAAHVRALEQRGERVLMVGDGINDAIGLSEASVGCAVAGGTDVALEVSDLALTQPDISRVADGLLIGRRTLAVIRQNLAWAFVYNVVALVLAVAGRLSPIHAAAAMALSSVCVVGNSLRLTRLGRP